LSESRRGAVFLDRDGTLCEDPGYLHDPAQVRLLPGVAEGLRRLAVAGWPLVVVSNQSGIARGLYAASAFHEVNRRVEELAGVRLAGAYFCPHHPDFTGPCDCRKPAPRLFQEAAKDLHLDVARSWFVGDRRGDVAPARALGGRPLLVRSAGHPDDVVEAERTGIPVVAHFLEAASLILASAP
jgi:histidinol-phosphate phosphatase family protein